MKYVRQIGIIWGMTMAGEFLNFLLPFPVPAGVYGLFLLLGALLTGVVKIESVEATGNFLMDIMSMMFIPATVGLVEYAQQIGEILVPLHRDYRLLHCGGDGGHRPSGPGHD